MIKLIQSFIKPPSTIQNPYLFGQLKQKGVQLSGVQRTNRLITQQQYGYKNFIYKWKVKYNMVNLIEDERKVFFFMKIVEKYYKDDIEKVKIGSVEVLKYMKDPLYMSRVRQLLLTALSKHESTEFYQLLQVRTNLINDLILIDDKVGAQKQLNFIKESYKYMKEQKIEIEELEKLMHTYVISNLQIQNFSEALIFADKLISNLEVLKAESVDNKSKQEELILRSIPIYSYLWTIFRQGQSNYSRAMEAYNTLYKIISKQDKKLVFFVNHKVLTLFDELMIDVIQFNIEQKEFKKCQDLFQFYTENMYKNPDKYKEFKNVNVILDELEGYYSYIDLSSQKFKKQQKVDQQDSDIYAYSVEEYYKYAFYINQDIGVDLNAFQIHSMIKKNILKFTGTSQKRLMSSIYKFDKHIKDQYAKDEIEEEEELKKQQGSQSNDKPADVQQQEGQQQQVQQNSQKQTLQHSTQQQQSIHKLKL